MGFRLYRRIKIAPGLSLNFSGSGLSLSAGVPGARMTFGPRGRTTSVGLPGTGISYRTHAGALGQGPSSDYCPAGDPRNHALFADAVTTGKTVSLNSTLLRDAYVRMQADPRFTLRDPTTGRKLSARQIEAMIRRSETEERADKLRGQISAEESTYRSVLSMWQRLPSMPGEQDLARALDPVPYPQDPPPEPDESRVLESLIARLTNDLRCHWPYRFLPRGLARKKAEKMAGELFDGAWTRAQNEYAGRLAEYEQYRAAWDGAETSRIQSVRAVFAGDPAAVHSAAVAWVENLQFPFPTSCEVCLDDRGGVCLLLDLPEIEDVVPTHVKDVTQKGTMKTRAIPESDRNRDYVTLVLGQCLLLARTLVAALPTVPWVRVAAYTQRERRSLSDPIDTFVFAADLTRQAVGAFDPSRDDLIGFIRSMNPLLCIRDRDWQLEPIQPPDWVGWFSEIRGQEGGTAGATEVSQS